MIPHIRQKQRRRAGDGSVPRLRRPGKRQGVVVGVVVGRGAVQANSCCTLTVIVTALKSELTWLLPVLSVREKLLDDVSPVMSIGVVTDTALTLPTASTGPSIATIWLGLTS